jgi:hypothetical protein
VITRPIKDGRTDLSDSDARVGARDMVQQLRIAGFSNMDIRLLLNEAMRLIVTANPNEGRPW